MKISSLPRPTVNLLDKDGNSFAILGTMSRELKRSGWTPSQVDVFMKEATSGDYDHLLRTCMKYADVV